MEITTRKENAVLYAEMAAAFGQEAKMVPGFFICGRFLEGYDDADGLGQVLLELSRNCYIGDLDKEVSGLGLDVPLLGNIDSDRFSLPGSTCSW